MISRGSLVAMLLGLLGLAGAAGLFALAHGIDNARLEQGVSLIHTLQQLDSKWSVEVLQVSSNPQADFDGLATISPVVRRNTQELRDVASTGPGIARGLKSAMMSYVSQLDSKEERIERFKSGYAIVRNSQRYLPVAAQLVTAKTAELQQHELGEAVKAQHEELENYFANPSAIDKQRIILSLDSLRVQRSE